MAPHSGRGRQAPWKTPLVHRPNLQVVPLRGAAHLTIHCAVTAKRWPRASRGYRRGALNRLDVAEIAVRRLLGFVAARIRRGLPQGERWNRPTCRRGRTAHSCPSAVDAATTTCPLVAPAHWIPRRRPRNQPPRAGRQPALDCRGSTSGNRRAGAGADEGVPVSGLRQATAAAAERARQEADAYRGNNPQPLSGYLAVLGLDAMLAAVTAIVAAATGRRLPDRWHGQDLITVAFGTHKLSRTMAKDAVTSPLRAPFAPPRGHCRSRRGARRNLSRQPAAPQPGRADDLPVLPRHVGGQRIGHRPDFCPAADPAGCGQLYRFGRRRFSPTGLRQGAAVCGGMR